MDKMEAIIQSYTPQECERIINGQQTIKVCKNAPKDTLFKVYIYCTSVKNMPLAKYVEVHKKTNGRIDCWHGKVIGEYVCEKVTLLKYNYCPHPELGYSANYDCGDSWYEWNDESIDLENFCLSEKELLTYGKGKPLSGLHISNVKIYDKPKELVEFRKPCLYGVSKCMYDDRPKCYDCDRTITRPPHGWQYVEE